MLGDDVPDGLRVILLPPDDFFTANIIIALGVYKDDLVKYLETHKWGPVPDHIRRELDDPNNAGFTGMTAPGCFFLYTRRLPKMPADHATLAHEIFHLVDTYVRKAMRTPLTEETDEIYARHISRLTRIVYERIQRWEG